LGKHVEVFNSVASKMVNTNAVVWYKFSEFLNSNIRVVCRQVHINGLIWHEFGELADKNGIFLVGITVEAVFPYGVIATTDMNSKTDSVELLHLCQDRKCITLVYCKQTAYFIAVFKKKIIVAYVPATHNDVPVAKHFAFQSLGIAFLMLETGSR